MRLILLAILLTLMSATAYARDTYQFKNGVVTTGDSIAGLIKRAGQPNRIVQLQNKYGASVGERWEYYIGDKTVSIYISGGKVTDIDDS